MRQRSNLRVFVVDASLLGSISLGYFAGVPDALFCAELIMWGFTILGWVLLLTMLATPKTKPGSIHQLHLADKWWNSLDEHTTFERYYDEITDVAYSVLLWIAGAPVLAVGYGVLTVFKGYSRTQGARQRLIDKARALSEQRE